MKLYQFAIFIVVFLTVYIGSSFVVINHIMNLIKPSKYRLIILTILIFINLSFIIGRLLANYIPLELSAFLTRIGYVWMSLLTYMFLYSVIFLILQKFNIVHITESFKISLLVIETIFFIGLFLIGYFLAINPIIKTHDIKIAKEFKTPLKVVQLSDLHLGYMYTEQMFERVVNKVKEINPDLILISGDFLENENGYAAKKDIAKSINQLNPKYGIFFSPGNHEYINNISESLKYISSLNINILRDSTIKINNEFYLIGKDDESAPRFTGNTLKPLKHLIPSNYSTPPLTILMTHQIKNHKDFTDKGLDLVISGHTHQGQFFPWNLVVKLLFDISYGYEKWGDTHFYVSSGTGFWGPPFRLGTRSEIVVFNLSPEN